MANNKLTKQQEAFIQEVIKTGNQRQAYRKAYPGSRKWKDESVDSEASRLLNSPKVSTRYSELQERLKNEAEDDCIVDAKDVLKELSLIAFSDIGDFVNVVEDDFGTTVIINSTANMSDGKRRAIAGIKQGRNGIELRLNDKTKALELIGRMLGLFTDNVNVRDVTTLADSVNAAYEKRKGGGEND